MHHFVEVKAHVRRSPKQNEQDLLHHRIYGLDDGPGVVIQTRNGDGNVEEENSFDDIGEALAHLGELLQEHVEAKGGGDSSGVYSPHLGEGD